MSAGVEAQPPRLSLRHGIMVAAEVDLFYFCLLDNKRV